MNCDNSEELFPVVDTAGNVVGKASRGECHGGSMLLHPVVHLHVFNSRGELYLQKRPAWKDIQPGRWDTAVGGHVDYGETVGEALRRELEQLPHVVALDADAVAKAAMAPRSANMALLGAAAPLLGIDAAKLESGIRAIFARKGGQVVETNLAAFRAGYEAAQKQTKP